MPLPSHIQSNGADNPTSVPTLSVSFAAPVSSGNAILVYYGHGNAIASTVTDDKGNTYVAFGADGTNNGYVDYIAYCLNVTNGPTTLTLNMSPFGNSYPFIIVSEFSGVSSYDTRTLSNYSNAISYPTGNITPASDGELLYTTGWAWSSGPMTVAAPFVFLHDGSGTYTNVSSGYFAQATAASIGAVWTTQSGSAQGATARIAAFKGVTAAPSVSEPVIQVIT